MKIKIEFVVNDDYYYDYEKSLQDFLNNIEDLVFSEIEITESKQ